MSVGNTVISYTSKSILQKFQQTQAFLDVNPHYHIKNTLNFKYGKWPDDIPLGVPKLRYFGIGIGGRYVVNDKGLMSPYIPPTTEQDLYQPIPFRCVPIDEDLTDAERANYRMRVIETIGTTKYACYYLKVLKPIDTRVQIFRVDSNTQITTPYELESKDLTPTPVKPSTGGVQDTTNSDILVGARVRMHFTANEVYEYIDARFADRREAVISEYGIYLGEDRFVEIASGTGPIRYTEAICTMLAFKTCTAGTLVETASWYTDRQILVGDGMALLLADAVPTP